MYSARSCSRHNQSFASQGIATPQSASWHGAFVELDDYPT